MAKPILALIRAGANSLHRAWTPRASHYIDIALSTFGDADIACEEAVFRHHCNGSKTEGIHAFFQEFGPALGQYRYFWFLDDDLFVPLSSVILIDKILARIPISLAQPALTSYSYASHAILFENKSFVLRITDFVEIMAPIVSRDFMPEVLPTLLENKSGWGIDWLWQRSLAQRREASVVFDAAPIVHTRPLGGPTYEAGGFAAADRELVELEKRHGLDPSRPMHNLCGFARHGEDIEFVTGPAFLKAILEGYAYTMDQDVETFQRCMNTAMQKTRVDDETRAKFRDAEPIRHILADLMRSPLRRHAKNIARESRMTPRVPEAAVACG